MNGFVTKELEDEYIKKNPNDYIWIGNIYIAYKIAQIIFCGINTYKVESDIILLDYFHPTNLKIMTNYINKINKNISESVQLYTGYNMSNEEQIRLIKNKISWTELWEFPEPIFDSGNIRYCKYDRRYEKDVNPVSQMKGLLYTDKLLTKKIFPDFLKKYNIDGILRKQVTGRFEIYGLTIEEIIIPVQLLHQKLKLDVSHPFYWGNWKTKTFKIPSDGFLLRGSISGKDNRNKYFRMIKFYFNNNNCNIRQITSNKNTISILSYNVHMFANINKQISFEDNKIKIFNFTKQLLCDIVIYQEFDIEVFDNFKQLMYNIGYIDYIIAPNGGLINKTQDSYVVLFSKKHLQSKRVIDLSVAKFKRAIVSVIYDNIKIAGVHLEVGVNVYDMNKLNIYRIKKEEENMNLRIKQLSKLLDHDIIAGDFNFDIKDSECQWLRKKNNFGLIKDNTSTTPFDTRTDMIFINRKSKLIPTYANTIKCNMSDHLPIIGTIKIS